MATNDEEVPAEELATSLAGGWDVEHARAFLAERRWLAAMDEYARAQRVPVHVLAERLGLAPALVEGVDFVRTRADLEARCD